MTLSSDTSLLGPKFLRFLRFTLGLYIFAYVSIYMPEVLFFVD